MGLCEQGSDLDGAGYYGNDYIGSIHRYCERLYDLLSDELRPGGSWQISYAGGFSFPGWALADRSDGVFIGECGYQQLFHYRYSDLQ